MATVTYAHGFAGDFNATSSNWMKIIQDGFHTLVSSGPTAWSIKGTSTSGLNNYTIVFKPAAGVSFSAPGSGDLPVGALGSIELYDSTGALVMTLTNLAGLNLCSPATWRVTWRVTWPSRSPGPRSATTAGSPDRPAREGRAVAGPALRVAWQGGGAG